MKTAKIIAAATVLGVVGFIAVRERNERARLEKAVNSLIANNPVLF